MSSIQPDLPDPRAALFAAPEAEGPAAAQARRDRLRLAQAQAEIAQLREASMALTRPAAAARHFLRSLRRRRPEAIAPAAAATPPRALVIDGEWPTPERDAGSVEIVRLLQTLHRLGFEVLFAAVKPQPAGTGPHAPGLRCLPAAEGPIEAFLERAGGGFDLCVLCRAYGGGPLLDIVQQRCGKARIVFNPIDLNFLREERRARLTGDADLAALLPQLRAWEERLIRESDATIVVSEAEQALVGRLVPEALCVQLPLAREPQAPAAPFAQRRGIGFVGNFEHAPNRDAIDYFLADIWPLLLQRLPDCQLSIAGAGLPPDRLAGHPGEIAYLGHVPDLGAWFEGLRLTIAPLRYGAGAKGKLASSLAAGVPAVISGIAAEGMDLDEAGVLLADDASAFALGIQRLHEDPALWARLSAQALAYAQRRLSPEAWQARLAGMLHRLGF